MDISVISIDRDNIYIRFFFLLFERNQVLKQQIPDFINAAHHLNMSRFLLYILRDILRSAKDDWMKNEAAQLCIFFRRYFV